MTERPSEEQENAPKQDPPESDPQAEGSEATPKPKDPVRRITRIVLGICLVIFIWYVFADRYTPFTDQARINSVIVPIAPRVSGYLTESNVRLHSIVYEGDVMFQLDERPFELAVRAAEASFDGASQRVGARTATVKSATARVGVSRAQLDRAQRNYNRTQRILEENPGALSLADKDRTETALAQAIEGLASAEANLEKANEELGELGPDNPELRGALVALEDAQLNLAFSTLHAPARGVIESFSVDVGHYAQAGQPLATFISSHDIWIQADMRENNISNIEPGDEAEFALDVAPGRVFTGTVRSVGYGVTPQGSQSGGDLPTVTSAQGWLRDSQRFPVIIDLNPDEVAGLLRVGGQVDVVVYTSGNVILNPIAWLRIRLVSLLSYVR